MATKHNERSDVNIDDHIFNLKHYDVDDYIAKFHQIKYSQPAINYKQQYLLIDGDLLDAFSYISPNKDNLEAYSIKLSSIIKNSANLFEIVAKDFYKKLFDVPNDPDDKSLNIVHYLKLCKKLKIDQAKFHALWVHDSTEEAPYNINNPFEAISDINIEDNWSKFCDDKAYRPDWWHAYNDLKHSLEGIKKANLKNAISATAATFLLLNRIYGPGFVDRLEKNEKGEIRITQVSRLFYVSP